MKKVILKLSAPWSTAKEYAVEALMHGINAFYTPPEIVDKVKSLGSVEVLSEGGGADIVVKAFDDRVQPEEGVIYRVKVTRKEDEEKVYSLAKAGAPAVIVEAEDWKIIPLENIIASIHKTNTELYAEAESVDEARTLLQTLELGVDAVIYEPKSTGEVAELAKLVQSKDVMPLTAAEVINVKEVGMGDRVCVDTCSILEVGEGMLVGSQAKGLFLVHSETLETEFTSPRPFRVNAGPVHSYTLSPNGKTMYLSELKAGDTVLTVNYKGAVREAVVGRVKIERRPLILVEAEKDGEVFKVILQNAETVALVGENGEALSVSRLKKGDKVLVYLSHKGRHFGKSVEETIIER
ncbi:MAG: 3-dehydroquinate synthase II [Candidatus Freyarchaeota archaeon]|nr:3-dehydroquinate synthase II [Candidatus Jordarchaeia archaeon]